MHTHCSLQSPQAITRTHTCSHYASDREPLAVCSASALMWSCIAQRKPFTATYNLLYFGQLHHVLRGRWFIAKSTAAFCWQIQFDLCFEYKLIIISLLKSKFISNYYCTHLGTWNNFMSKGLLAPSPLLTTYLSLSQLVKK